MKKILSVLIICITVFFNLNSTANAMGFPCDMPTRDGYKIVMQDQSITFLDDNGVEQSGTVLLAAGDYKDIINTAHYLILVNKVDKKTQEFISGYYITLTAKEAAEKVIAVH